jgi:hypothetical protein
MHHGCLSDILTERTSAAAKEKRVKVLPMPYKFCCLSSPDCAAEDHT